MKYPEELRELTWKIRALTLQYNYHYNECLDLKQELKLLEKQLNGFRKSKATNE